MNSEAASFLERAHQSLEEAKIMFQTGATILAAGVGRASYYAAYHAAEAFIITKNGDSKKNHDKVRSEFGRLVKDDLRVDREIKKFLNTSYRYKNIGDYGEGGKRTDITLAIAEEAIKTATRFVALIEQMIATDA